MSCANGNRNGRLKLSGCLIRAAKPWDSSATVCLLDPPSLVDILVAQAFCVFLAPAASEASRVRSARLSMSSTEITAALDPSTNPEHRPNCSARVSSSPAPPLPHSPTPPPPPPFPPLFFFNRIATALRRTSYGGR